MAQDPPRQDAIRYDLMVQDALRGVVRKVLTDTAKHGLPGEHHYYVTFDTRMAGVKISPRMLQKYPETMNVVLQHVFWDLNVHDEYFEVGLSFGGVGEKLVVPFGAVTQFVDPSVDFGLKFEVRGEPRSSEAAPEDAPAAPARRKLSAVRDSEPPAERPAQTKPAVKAEAAAPRREPMLTAVKDKPREPPPAKDAGAPKDAAKVVSIDAFRKKP